MPVIGDAVLRVTADTRPFRRTLASLEVAGVGLFASVGSAAATTAAKIGKTVGLIAAGTIAAVTFAFGRFEHAFAGVARTVEASAEELATIRSELIAISKQIPISARELAEIGLVAGQLGIAAKDIAAFSEVAAKLGVVTELSSEEAAEGLARVSQITGALAKDFDNLASVLVDLGNKFVSTEGDILKISIRIAGAGKVVGIAAQEILGIGNAFASVVGPAGLEAAGTAIQKVLLGIEKAVQEGGAKLAEFARVAGVSAREFADLWAKAPAEAFTLFVEGLGKSGKEAIGILEELELRDARLIRTFLQVAGAGDILRRSISEANREFRENLALEREFAKFAETLKSQFQIFKNNVEAVGIELGELLKPGLIGALKELSTIVGEVAGVLAPSIREFNGVLPEFAKLLGEGLLGVLKAVGGFIEGFVRIFDEFTPTIREFFDVLGEFTSGVGQIFSKLLLDNRESIDRLIEGLRILIGFVLEVGSALAEGITQVLPNLVGALLNILEHIQPLIDAISTSLIPALVTMINTGIIPAANAILTALIPVFTLFINVIAGALKELAPFINTLGGIVAGIIQEFGEVLPDVGIAIGEIIRALTPLIKAIGGAFIDVIHAAIPVVKAMVPVIKSLIPVLVTLAEAIGPIAETLGEAFVEIINSIGPVLPDLLLAIGEAIAVLAPAFAELVVALAPVIADVLQAITPYIPELARAFTDLVIALIPLIPVLGDIAVPLAEVLASFTPHLVDILTELVEMFNSLPGPLKEILVIAGLGGWAGTKMFGFFSTLATRIGGLFGPGGLINIAMTRLGLFGLKLGEMGGPIGTFGDKLAGLANKMIGPGGFTGALGGVGRAITTNILGGSSGSLIAGAGGTAVGLIGAIAAGVGLGVVLHNLIEEHFPGFNRALEGVGGAISDFLFGTGEKGQVGLFGEIGGFFEDLGGKLVDGLITGIKALINFLLKFRFAFPSNVDRALEASKEQLASFAGGGRFSAGQWAVVGERGPEIVRFDGTGEVFPANHPTTKAMLGLFESLFIRTGHYDPVGDREKMKAWMDMFPNAFKPPADNPYAEYWRELHIHSPSDKPEVVARTIADYLVKEGYR